MEIKTFHPRKETIQAFFRGLDIDELVLLVFWRMDTVDDYMLLLDLSGLKMCSDHIWTFLVSHEWMVSQRMTSTSVQIILTISAKKLNL